jgi:TonB family protein
MPARSLALVLLSVTATLTPRLAAAELPSNENSARTMRLERFVLPEFPVFLRHTGVTQGTVVIALSHDARGRADDVLVLESSDPRFTDAVLEAVRAWRFNTGPDAEAAREAEIPVVRFAFVSGTISVVSLAVTGGTRSRKVVRPETPIELPNFSHLDAMPRAVRQPHPEFPLALRERVAQGNALVKYFVDTEGRVRLPVVVTASAPEFGEAALAAVRQWRFEPPRIDGKPVVALERQFFQFEKK